MANIKNVIENSFVNYAGAVLQSRALVDVRDILKPSARQIFYCLFTDKFISSKPFKKTLKGIGSAMRMYIHGDSSCEGVIMRAGQPFAMRYPLIEVEGSYGSLMESGNWAASRYTASRLSPLAEYLFKDINKDTIAEWRDNYDDTEKYPAVLPTKGFYNLVNGTSGIGVGAASSIPQFNLNELNISLIKLLVNPNTPFEEIYCVPDFATGGILLNEKEIRESLKKGTGAACKLRAVMEYDNKDHCLVVTEIPYGVYTNTICGQLEELLEREDNPGIERFNDLTGTSPLIKIYLTKNVNISKVTQYLYKNTSLQYHYAINMTMLENGRYPKVFGFKDALLSYLKHQQEVYRRGFEFDLNKINKRLNIIDGLLIAIADIDNVIQIIKQSKNKDAAKVALIDKYDFNNEQVSAILEMKLSRLTNLETVDLQTEKGELLKEFERIQSILSDIKLLNLEIEKDLRAVMNKFGDKRRTKIMNVVAEEANTNSTTETTPTTYVYAVCDGGIIPFTPEQKIVVNKKGSGLNHCQVNFGYISDDTKTVIGIAADGSMTKIVNGRLIENSLNAVATKAPLISVINDFNKKYFITVSKNGVVKKSLCSEYSRTSRSTVAAKVRENDSLIWAGCAAEDEYLFIVGKQGGLVKLSMDSITTTGRATIGSKGINDEAISAAVGADTDKMFVVASGKGKFSLGAEYSISTKGSKGQTVGENTTLIANVKNDFYIIEKGVKLTRYTLNSFATKGKAAMGAKVSNESNLDLAY